MVWLLLGSCCERLSCGRGWIDTRICTCTYMYVDGPEKLFFFIALRILPMILYGRISLVEGRCANQTIGFEGRRGDSTHLYRFLFCLDYHIAIDIAIHPPSVPSPHNPSFQLNPCIPS